MEVDGPVIEQAADGALIAPPAVAAANLAQPNSAAATAPGQSIACISAFPPVPTTTTYADR